MNAPLLRCAIQTFALSSLIVTSSAAQTPQVSSQANAVADVVPSQFAGMPNSPDAPDSPGGWLIQIATIGQFASTGIDLTITSSGVVTCARHPEDCRATVEGPALAARSTGDATLASLRRAREGSVH
jgi:hypothetical protein